MTTTNYNEWQMLCLTEDIEPGETIIVENIFTPEDTMQVVVCHESQDGQWLQTRDAQGKPFVFNTESLEQKGKRTKQWRIKGKSPFAPIRLPKLKNLPAIDSLESMG